MTVSILGYLAYSSMGPRPMSYPTQSWTSQQPTTPQTAPGILGPCPHHGFYTSSSFMGYSPIDIDQAMNH